MHLMCITCVIVSVAVGKVYAEIIIYMVRSLTNYQVLFAGPDDMPAHIKSSMFGCSLTIPITNGRLNMGTWQVHENI